MICIYVRGRSHFAKNIFYSILFYHHHYQVELNLTIINIIIYLHHHQVEFNLTKPNLATTGTSTQGEP